MHGWWKTPADDETLKTLLAAAERWLLNDARHHVGMVSGRHRAALLNFEGQEVAEVSQNKTYSFRHFERSLLPDLKRLLCFAWRHPRQPIGVFVGKGGQLLSADSYAVPKILVKLHLESVESFWEHPVAVEYCLARCFRMPRGKQSDSSELEMPVCGDIASICSATLSVLRAGICSHLVSLKDGVDTSGYALVQEACLACFCLCVPHTSYSAECL